MARVLVRVGQALSGGAVVAGVVTELYASVRTSGGAAIPALFGLALSILFGFLGGLVGSIAWVSDRANKRAALLALALGLAAPLITFGFLLALISPSAFKI